MKYFKVLGGFLSVAFLALFFSGDVHAESVPGLTFGSYANNVGNDTVTSIQSDPNYDRLYVADRSGRIKVYDQSSTSIVNSNFLNLSTSGLSFSSGGEKGLLGLALDPDYRNNGYVYIAYTDNNSPFNLVIDRFTVNTDPDDETASINLGSRVNIRKISQPYSNHNGGDLAFGPDGYLYISVGDGGSANDPQNYAQRKNNLLGKILRLNVNNLGGDDIPEDNPFKNAPGYDAIQHYGLRNPWRISFDSLTGDLWIADVGQGNREEVDFVRNGGPAGLNFGWRCREGLMANPDYSNCALNGPATNPIGQYSHDGGRCSVTGGYVYRGSTYPAMYGKYFFADYCTGDVYTLEPHPDNSGKWQKTYQGDLTAENISTFGVDQNGELFAGTAGGDILEITSGSALPLLFPTTPGYVSDHGNTGIGTEWKTIDISTEIGPFSEKPVVVVDVTSENGSDKVYPEIRNVTPTSFQARIRENEKVDNGGHLTESLTYRAVQQSYSYAGEEEYVGTLTVGDYWQTVAFPVPFGSLPAVLVEKQTMNGSDLAYAQIRNVTNTSFDIRIVEPPGWDGGHIPEVVGWYAWEQGAHPWLGNFYDSVTDNWASKVYGSAINFPNGILFDPYTENDNALFNLDVRNISEAGFEMMIEEESILDGTHANEEFNYLEIPDVLDIAAQSGKASVGDKWMNVPFDRLFPSTPTVFAQIQTENGWNTVEVDIRNVTNSGFQMRLEEDKGAGWDGNHVNETVSWYALDSIYGSMAFGNVSVDNNWEAGLPYGDTFGATPFVISQIQSENEADTAATDINNVGVGNFDLRVEEELNSTWDGVHINETVGFLAFQNAPSGISNFTGVNHNWTTIDISSGAFSTVPNILATIITENGADTVNVDIRNVTTTSFEIRIEEEPMVNNGNHVVETVGWWAFESSIVDAIP